MSQDQSLGVIDATDAHVLPPQSALALRPSYEVNAELATLEADIASDFAAARSLAEQAVERAISCGLRLIRYKKILQTRDFKKRVETTFGEASYRNATRYMKLLHQLDADHQKAAEAAKVPRGTTLDTLTNSPIERKQFDAFAEAVREQITGKHLTELYRLNGVIREPKRANAEGKNGSSAPVSPEEQVAAERDDAKAYWIARTEEIEDDVFKLKRWTLLRTKEKREYSERIVEAMQEILRSCKAEKALPPKL